MQINLLWIISTALLILAALYFTAVFYLRIKWKISAQSIENKKTELAPIISNFLFHSVDDPKEEQQEYVKLKIAIRDHLQHKRVRKVISQVLFDLQKDISGGARQRLFRLYKQLELHHDSMKKLESRNWHIVSQGILELAKMQVTESFHIISKFINDRRGTVRKQAEIALVYLEEKGINYLLDNTKNTISEWQQLKIIEALSIHEHYEPPQFKNWLVSHNKDVVLFSLYLIKYFNQKGAEKSITTLARHKEDVVKMAAIECLLHFNFFKSIPKLKEVFWSCSESVKIAILNAIGHMGNAHDLSFLRWVEHKETNFLVKTKAQGAINQISPESILPTKDLLEDLITDHDNMVKVQTPMGDKEVKVKFELGKTAKEDHIEVEEIEIYDEVLPSTSIRGKTSTQTNQESLEMHEADEGINAFMGLVSAEEQEGSEGTLPDTYSALDIKDRTQLIGHLEESADLRELSLLEEIVEVEENPDLRFKAFQILKRIKEEHLLNKASNQVTPKPFYPSPFEGLLTKTNNYKTLKMLYQMILNQGGYKEIELLNSRREKVKGTELKWLEESLVALHSKVSEKEKTEQGMQKILPKELSINKEGITKLNNKSITSEKIPLEDLFQYEDLGILNTYEPQELDFTFELSDEFFEQNLIPKRHG